MPRARKLIYTQKLNRAHSCAKFNTRRIVFSLCAKISTKGTKKLNLHVKLNECTQNLLSGYQNKIYLISTVIN